MVRRLSAIEFEGFTWEERFIKIATSFDFAAAGKDYCTRSYFSDPDEWLNMFKVKGNGPPGIWRAIMPVPANESDEQGLSMAAIRADWRRGERSKMPTPAATHWAGR